MLALAVDAGDEVLELGVLALELAQHRLVVAVLVHLYDDTTRTRTHPRSCDSTQATRAGLSPLCFPLSLLWTTFE